MTVEHRQHAGSNSRICGLMSSVLVVLASRAYSVIIFSALFCTLGAKLFHSIRIHMTSEYLGCIFSDIAVLLTAEVILSALCFRWPRKWMFRIATAVAAVICTWSVINAGWLIRTGTQVLPSVFLPLLRDPLSSLGIIGVNLVKMPVSAILLLGPSAIVLAFFFFVMAKPKLVSFNRRYFIGKTAVFVVIVIVTSAAGAARKHTSIEIASADLPSNCQLKCIASLLDSDAVDRWSGCNFPEITREIPAYDEMDVSLLTDRVEAKRYNVVLIVLEGVQYRYTSLCKDKANLTPFLGSLAEQGVEFCNARSSLTHTTKALFALLTGRWPSGCQDIAEAVPAERPYAGIASLLKSKLGFRTAFFTSSKGEFECGPGLAYNTGFDQFFARENLKGTDSFVGYMSCDEFAMLKPMFRWIDSDKRPFFLTFMCSVSHDPYVIPRSFGVAAREPLQRYKQTIAYTDCFLAAFDTELRKRHLGNNTVFCVISDHAEGFGEHGLFAHEKIAFDEALHIPWVIRAPGLLNPATKITQPVSSVDVAPTILSLLGVETNNLGFDGANALGFMPEDRKVYFAGWMWQGPAGFVQGNKKFVYDPTSKMVTSYNLDADPFELAGVEITGARAEKIAEQIIGWRKKTVFHINQRRVGETTLFNRWLCRWENRIAWAKYLKQKRGSVHPVSHAAP